MITIINQPITTQISYGIYSSVMPVYNTIEWGVSSDNISNCKFKYIADIYVNGVYVKRLKLFPDKNGEANFKINRVLEDYIINTSITNLMTSSLFQAISSPILEYTVSFGEEYDTSTDCDQVSTVYPDLLITDINYAWNGAMQYREYYDFNNSTHPYILSSIKPGKFLTHSPSTILIGMGEQAELTFLNMPNSGYNADRIVIETYDRNGIMLDTNDYPNPNIGVSDYTQMYNIVGVGPENINNIIGYPLVNVNTYEYKVYLVGTDSAQLLNNPTLQYLSGTNSWTTDNEVGCSAYFGITVADKLQFVLPDASCRQLFTVQYYDFNLTANKTYNVTYTVDTLNNPSSEAQYSQISIGGNLGTANVGLGTFTENIQAGTGGVLRIIGYMDADTAGFGSHSFSINNIEIYEVGGTRTSEIKTYQIDRRPSRYKPLRFRWLNRLGGYDSYSFNLAKNRTTTINRTEYDALLKTNYAIGNRGRTITSVTAKDRINANSNWLTEAESNWLEELYTSSSTFVQDTNIIYNFWKIAPLVGKPVLYVSCPLSEQEQLDLNGDSILIDKCDKTVNFDLETVWPADVISDNRIRIITTLYDPISSDSGIFYRWRNQLAQVPIIITSSLFNEITKAKTKNISQTIEFEYAFDKNIQRN